MVTESEINEIYRYVRSLKNSFDSHFLESGSVSRLMSREIFKEYLLKIEAIRIDLYQMRISRSNSENDLVKIYNQIILLQNDKDFNRIAVGVRFRTLVRSNINIVPQLTQGGITASEAISIIIKRVDEILFSVKNGHNETRGLLREVIPSRQRAAPVFFDIVGGRIDVVTPPAQPLSKDLENIEAARNALVESGRNIVEALESSNCDHRIIESVRDLQSKLEIRNGVISLGLTNISVERICRGAAAEIPDAILGAIEGHIAGIGMYVAQFTEWQRFSENAAEVNLDISDIISIRNATQAAIEKISENESISTDAVPQTLKKINDFISDPKAASKKAAFAVLRTIENMMAKIFEYGSDLVDKTIIKSIDGLSTGASKLIVASMLAIAIAVISNLGAVTAKIPEASWMRSAYEIVVRKIDELTR